MAHHYRVRFLPMDIAFPAEETETVLETAMRSGIHINASCGANGTCGKCRIRVREGEVASTSRSRLSASDYESGIRLACMTRPLGDIVVEIPFDSQVDRTALKARKEAGHILSAVDIDRLVTGWSVDPAVFKKYVEVPPPSSEDNMNDLARLFRELKKRHGIDDIFADFEVMGRLARVMREADWRITATIEAGKNSNRLINVEAGNREDGHCSIVIDIGTTTVCGQLLDLARCEAVRRTGTLKNGSRLCTLAEASDYNGQISYGDDVISRIMYAQKPGGLKRLQEVVVGTINGVIGELIRTSGADPASVSHVVFAGNTTMTHLVLGLDPKYLMLPPYTPTADFIPPVRAVDLGLKVGGHVHVYTFPCVASYVGGDIVAGILGSGIFQRDEIALYMDIGTNGEIVIGNREWLTCTSCSAGPAFEGGGITHGMRAGKGAIEQIRVNPSTYEPMILTIGRTKPAGICGSGLIDVVSGLFEAGVVDQNGKINRELATERVREGESGWEYVICYAEDTHTGRDIVITEADLDNLIRAKAAIYAGCKTLLDTVGLELADVERIIIAGGFGHYIDIEKAQTIGLLPDIPPERFTFVGNGSLLGARLLSFSRELLRETARIARSMTNIELSSNPSFMHEFMAALFIPHTDENAFPRIMERIRNRKGRVVDHA